MPISEAEQFLNKARSEAQRIMREHRKDRMCVHARPCVSFLDDAFDALERELQHSVSVPLGDLVSREEAAKVVKQWLDAAEAKLLEKNPKYGKSYWMGRSDCAEGIAKDIAALPAVSVPVPIDVEPYIARAAGLSNQGRFEDAFGVLVSTLRALGPRAAPSPSEEAIQQAVDEIAEWLRGNGPVDGNGRKEVAAIIRKHLNPKE